MLKLRLLSYLQFVFLFNKEKVDFKVARSNSLLLLGDSQTPSGSLGRHVALRIQALAVLLILAIPGCLN